MPYIVIDLLGDEDTVIVTTPDENKQAKQPERPLITDLVDLQLELVIPSPTKSYSP